MKMQIRAVFTLFMGIISSFWIGCKKPDTTAPVVTIIGGNVSLFIGQTYTEQGATANDTQDGDLTDRIEINIIPNTSLSGYYDVKYTVTDNANNEGSADRIVNVSNQASSLIGKYDVYDSVVSGPNAGLVTLYTDSITMSTAVNNQIVVRSFGSYINGAVYMDVINNMSSLTIPSQTPTCGSPATTRNFISLTSPSAPMISGTSPTTITFYFQEISNSTTFTKYERYVRLP